MEIKKIKSLNDVENLIIESMREKKADILSVLRLIKAKVVLEEKKNGESLTEETFQGILVTSIKEHRDSIAEYKKANRPDLAEKEEKELNIIMELTPGATFSNEDVIKCVNEEVAKIKAENGSVSMKDMKPIMAVVKEKFPFADGGFIAKTVKENIA
jgi:uncharacterized protein YqeY